MLAVSQTCHALVTYLPSTALEALGPRPQASFYLCRPPVGPAGAGEPRVVCFT